MNAADVADLHRTFVEFYETGNVTAALCSFAIRDGNLVTGQQNFSGAETARLILEAVGR